MSLLCSSFRLARMASIRRPSPLWASRFHIGDTVLVSASNGRGEDDDSLLGRIDDVRGSGWYLVSLMNRQQDEIIESIKCRSTQLRMVEQSPMFGDDSIGSRSNANARTPEPLPIPPIQNFDTLLQAHEPSQSHEELFRQLELFEHYHQWVAFTDLHCATATVETCKQVLQKVHFEASQRDAGILFLGDWWHVRGSLKVDLVNAMLSQLSNWTQPMIMIPGNHDQASWHTNEDHALRIFHNAYRIQKSSGVMVFSYPTVFMNALFVPHIRSPDILRSVLEIATESRTIFCHADITGSSMNDNIVSQGGINPSVFGGRLTYTGHFHKPHVIAGHNITYLGSPYEISLAEAEQEKELVVFDRNASWIIKERIQLGGIGKQHYRPSNLSDFERVIKKLKTGDRVVFDQPNNLNPQEVELIQGHVQSIRNLGALAEIRPKSATKGSDEIAETMRMQTEAASPTSIWSSFLAQQASRGLIDDRTVDEMRAEGPKIMAEVEEEADGTLSITNAATKLHLRHVDVEGFGPFVESTFYSLDNKGLVLLRGENEDDGADR